MTKEITLKKYISAPLVQDRIKEVLQGKSQQFIVSMLSLVNSNSALAECDPPSVLNAAMTAASLDLPVNQNLGFAYILPYNVKQKDGSYRKMAQFQLGYKGFIQLSQRSGQFKTINVSDVRQGEIESMDRLTGEIFFDWKDDREKLELIGYVGYMELTNGFKKSLYMTISELSQHGTKYSANYRKYKSGLWNDNFDAMARKTVIKLLLSRYAPLSTQMQEAQLVDQSVRAEDGSVIYADNQKETAQDIAREKEIEKIENHIKASKTVDELRECEIAVYDMENEDLKESFTKKLNKLTK